MQNLIPLCNFEAPKFFLISNQVPSLVYYSHIPLILISFIIAFLIFIKGKKTLSNKILLFTLVTFTCWVVMSLMFWANNRSDIVMLVWHWTLLLEPLIYIGSLYFVKVIMDEKDITFREKLVISALYLPVIVFLPTHLSLSGFDVGTCLSIEGPLALYYIYFIETIFILWILFYTSRRYKKELQRKNKKEIALIGAGIIFFLLSFSWGNLIGSFTDNWKLGEFGLLGMPIFIGFLTYTIIKFKLFNLKLIGANVLVVTLWILNASLLLINDISISHVIVAITLIFTIIFGLFLIQSVRKEVTEREKNEQLAKALEAANIKLKELDGLKSEFLSFASHQLRNPLTAVKGYASLVLEGDYGTVDPKIVEVFKTISASTQNLLVMVQEFLDISKIEQGGMKYDMGPIDVRKLALSVVDQTKPNIEIKGLTHTLTIPDDSSYTSLGDENKLRQVFINIIDNCIKYTPTGSLSMTLEHIGPNIVFKIVDTGVGISAEDLPKLFGKFNRATGANKINVVGSGLGLYLAKQIIEAHRGSIKVESPGKGLGSTFTITLPAK